MFSKFTIYLFWVIVCLALLPGMVYAQEQSLQPTAEKPYLEIRNVNVDQFPVVTLAVTEGPNKEGNFSKKIYENDNSVAVNTVLTDTTKDIGVQLAVVVDPRDMLTPGKFKGSRYEGVIDAINGLTDQPSLLSNATDRLAAYTVGANGEGRVIQDWTVEPIAIYNRLALHTLEPITETSRLNPLLNTVLDQFENPTTPPDVTIPASLTRAILLFSVGAEGLNFDEVIAKAKALQVHIHVVELAAPDQIANATSTLQQLATQTHGRYVFLEAPENLAPLWERLRSERQQRVLMYRSSATLPLRVIRVEATLADGASISDRLEGDRIPSINLEPPQIEVVAPQTGEAFEWAPLDPNNNTAQPKPETLNFKVNFLRNDQRDIKLSEVTYVLEGPEGFSSTEQKLTEPFGEVAFSIDPAREGIYTLKITAKDEFGGLSNFTFGGVRAVRQLAPPTATPLPAPTLTPAPTTVATADSGPLATEAEQIATNRNEFTIPIVNQTLSRSALQIVVASLSIVAVTLVVYPYLRSRARRTQPVSAAVNTWDFPREGEMFAADSGASEREDLREREQVNRDDNRQQGNKIPGTKTDPVDFVDLPVLAYLAPSEKNPGLPVFELKEGDEIHVGREIEEDLREERSRNTLSINHRTVSRDHAMLRRLHHYEKYTLAISDRGSTGGTHVNGERLGKQVKEKELRGGEKIRFGEIEYYFRYNDSRIPAKVVSEATVATTP